MHRGRPRFNPSGGPAASRSRQHLDFATISAIYRAMRWSIPVLAAALALATLAAPAPASARPAVAARLAEQDRADLERIERYLNDIRTLASPFLQVAADGGQARGTVSIARPGRIRIDYEPPASLLVVGSRGSVVVYDRELKQANYVGIDQTPIGVLVRDQVRLSGDVTVTRFERGPNVIRVTLARSDDADAGRVMLAFDDRPLQLRQWVVTDPQGTETRVSLLDPRLGVPLDPALFEFTPPDRGTRSGGRQ
jgi:outer membrane lipoprotein-sorting protein